MQNNTHYIDLIENITRTPDSRLENLSLAYVPVEMLLVTQSQLESFDKQHLLDIAENFHPALMRASSVALINGSYILWEGQHTAGAAWICGMDTIPCMVYKCDDLAFKNIASIEKFDNNQFAHLIDMFMEDTGCNTLDEVKATLRDFNTNV